jgi:hypothetical protein
MFTDFVEDRESAQPGSPIPALTPPTVISRERRAEPSGTPHPARDREIYRRNPRGPSRRPGPACPALSSPRVPRGRPRPKEESRPHPADGVILREAHPRSCRDARKPVRRPKNLPDGRTILSATTGFGARSPARFRKRFFGRRTGCRALPQARGGRLPQNDSGRPCPLFLRIRQDPAGRIAGYAAISRRGRGRTRRARWPPSPRARPRSRLRG